MDDDNYIEFVYKHGKSKITHHLPEDLNIWDIAQEFKLFLLSMGYGNGNVKKIFPEDFS